MNVRPLAHESRCGGRIVVVWYCTTQQVALRVRRRSSAQSPTLWPLTVHDNFSAFHHALSWSYDRRWWASLPAWPETSGRLARISKTPSARSAINMFGDDTKRRAFQRRRGRGRRSMSKRENFSALPMDAYGDRGQRDLSSENSRPLPEEGHRLMPAFLRIEKTSVRKALVNFVEELSTRRTRSSANEAAGLSAADSETHRRQEHHMYIWEALLARQSTRVILSG